MKRMIFAVSALVMLLSLTACPFWRDPPGPLPAPAKILPHPGPHPGGPRHP